MNKFTASWIKMYSKYDSKCKYCDKMIYMSTPIYWNSLIKKAVHVRCWEKKQKRR